MEAPIRRNFEVRMHFQFDAAQALKNKATDHYDIFLSHSMKDQDRVERILQHFKVQSQSVYVDWMEERLEDPRGMATELANRLRLRMRAAETMIYVHSPNSTLSRWCCWELGFFDAIKPGQIFVDRSKREPLSGLLGLYPIFDWID